MDKKTILKKTEIFMRENIPKSRLTKEDSSKFYIKHVLGVQKYSLQLAKTYNANEFIVSMAALLHDIGADSGEKHASESAKISKSFLSTFNIPAETKEKIIRCIERHSIGSKTDTIEEQIIQDADGIIFIENTFKFFFERGQQMFPIEKARQHAIVKTESMMNKINTEKGIGLAKKFLARALTYLKSAS